MDLKQIKELMAAMQRAGLRRLRIKEEKGFELELEREGEKIESSSHPSIQHSFYHPPIPQGFREYHPPIQHHPAAPMDAPKAKEEAQKDNGVYITSPMVGTFYTSSAPNKPAYVKVGDKVTPDTVVCIIEAMKVMNEVKAGVSGVIEEILINNAHPVEFGAKLYKVKVE